MKCNSVIFDMEENGVQWQAAIDLSKDKVLEFDVDVQLTREGKEIIIIKCIRITAQSTEFSTYINNLESLKL